MDQLEGEVPHTTVRLGIIFSHGIFYSQSEYQRVTGHSAPELGINEMLGALNLECIGDDRYRNATDGARNNVTLLKHLAERSKAPLWPSSGRPAAAAVDPASFNVFPEIEKDIFKTSRSG